MIANNGSCAGNVTAATAYEPGGGSTLMAYAGSCTGNSYQLTPDLYFHAGSVAQIASYATSGTGNSCPVKPVRETQLQPLRAAAASYTIPVSTPFMLTAAGADAREMTSRIPGNRWMQLRKSAPRLLLPRRRVRISALSPVGYRHALFSQYGSCAGRNHANL